MEKVSKFSLRLLYCILIIFAIVFFTLANKYLPVVKIQLENYRGTTANVDDDDVISINVSETNQFYKCIKRVAPSTTNEMSSIKWKLRPKICQKNISTILLIKSSIYRNFIRQIARYTWAQQFDTEK